VLLIIDIVEEVAEKDSMLLYISCSEVQKFLRVAPKVD
jgi:hypothetical protein